eukprot:14419436-Alexandrium_andersonii.AAC.1
MGKAKHPRPHAQNCCVQISDAEHCMLQSCALLCAFWRFQTAPNNAQQRRTSPKQLQNAPM